MLGFVRLKPVVSGKSPGFIYFSLPSPPPIKGWLYSELLSSFLHLLVCLLIGNISWVVIFSLSFGFLGFWVHCNDSKLNVCSVEEVCKTQAYILFYTQRTVQGNARISETQLQAQVQSSNNDEGRPRTFP